MTGDHRRDPADRMLLTGLTVRTTHGALPFEREHPQTFVIDVELELPLAAAGASDDVVDTVHYGELAEGIARAVEGPPVNLIETLAQRVADVCLADPRVERATVTVHKPEAPIPVPFGDVAVRITRGR